MSDSKLSRRKFLTMCAGAVVLAGGGFLLASKKDQLINEFDGVKFVRQLVASDNATARTIMWQTDIENKEISLEYRSKNSATIQKVTPNCEEFSDDGQTQFIYTVELTDLPLATDCEYRLVDNDKNGPWHTLKLANNDNLCALIFPDSQSSDYTDWKNLAQTAAKRNMQADCFINMGDLVDNGEDHYQWNEWFKAVDGIIDRIPLVPVMGNHETYNRDWQVREPLAYLREFAVPTNDSTKFSRYYYSFDYGPVHFVVLNTQQYEVNNYADGKALLREQQAWFYNDMKATTKPWKIVLMHRDVLDYRIKNRPERREGISEEGIAWMPIFEQLKVDVVFTAHLHTYRNRGHLQNFDSANSGPYYILTGVAGNVRYTDFWLDHALDKKKAPQPETDNYLVLTVNADKLQVSCYLPDGTEIDKVELNHN